MMNLYKVPIPIMITIMLSYAKPILPSTFKFMLPK
jgi:hypothetical protein